MAVPVVAIIWNMRCIAGVRGISRHRTFRRYRCSRPRRCLPGHLLAADAMADDLGAREQAVAAGVIGMTVRVDQVAKRRVETVRIWAMNAAAIEATIVASMTSRPSSLARESRRC